VLHKLGDKELQPIKVAAMHRSKLILFVLLLGVCLAVADFWLLGKIHFSRLWLTREQNQEERQALGQLVLGG